MPVCTKCREPKRAEDFAKNASRGKPIVTLCKLCVAEQAKLSFREKRFPRFAAEVRKWESVKLLSEEAWLVTKLTAIRKELDARTRRAD